MVSFASLYPTQIWNKHGLIGLVFMAAVVYALYYLYMYLSQRGSTSVRSSEKMSDASGNPAAAAASSNMMQQPNGPQPSIAGGNEMYASPNEPAQSGGYFRKPQQNPSDLLPKDVNSSWATFSPSGKGEFSDVSLLRAGYLQDMSGLTAQYSGSMRNSSQDLRSEPPVPITHESLFNKPTIARDNSFQPRSFEIGQGAL